MHIGFDDTDSTRQGCTTYVAALLIEKLEKIGVTFTDYPLLIRLNPNVPWKTRGNGALCLRVEFDEDLETEIKELTVNLVESHSDLEWKGTDPGIVFLKETKVPKEITSFAKKAETKIVTIEEALQVIRTFRAEALGYNTQQGIIGALAAIGETLQQDHTYELISYRKPENIGSKRQIDYDSILKMDETLKPLTFNNVDAEKHRVIITPRGPDPILFGIRGETPQVVTQAFDMAKVLEPIERWVIFRSNQGTDAHFTRINSLAQAEPFRSIIAKGTVIKNPYVIPGKHLIFSITDETAEVDCAAYEPTGLLQQIVRKLQIGDCIEVYGAVRKLSVSNLFTINLEKINILTLANQSISKNPLCPSCGKRLKSMGKNQGLRCEVCRTRFSDLEKTEIPKNRNLETGLFIASPGSQRHLTKPLRRYGQEKCEAEMIKPIGKWHSVLVT
jgi:tRNA(Ile2)-agmatinylcytidine synthase